MSPLYGLFTPGAIGLLVLVVSFVRWVAFPCNRYVGARR